MFLLTNDFYSSVLRKLLEEEILAKNMKILITAGGVKDRNRFLELGFNDVTVSNIDKRMNEASFLPFKWSFQDVENLTFKDGEFDICAVHHGLHHCSSPHRGFAELYRCSKCGVLVFEGIDNLITRAGRLLGIGEEYELAAVRDNDFRYGGFKNTSIPNFVYRWTDREVYKTAAVLDPVAKPDIKYFYGLELPLNRLKNKKARLPFLIASAAYPFLFILFAIFHKVFGNRYAFFIKKPDISKVHFPWLRYEEGRIKPDIDYIKRGFKNGF
jgi:SAM-dependent methyltransferase